MICTKGDTVIPFVESSTRDNISSNDTTSSIFGKISKWFSDLKSLAFLDKVGTNQLDSTLTVEYDKRITTDNVTTSINVTEPGFVTDARAINTVNTTLSNFINNRKPSNFTINDTTTISDVYEFVKSNYFILPLECGTQNIYPSWGMAMIINASGNVSLPSDITVKIIVHDDNSPDMAIYYGWCEPPSTLVKNLTCYTVNTTVKS